MKSKTTFFELNFAIQKNLSLLFYYWQTFQQQKELKDGFLLLLRVYSIFSDWKYSSSCSLVEYSRANRIAHIDDDEEENTTFAEELFSIFDFLERKNTNHSNQVICLFVDSKKESFHSPYLFLDFSILLDVHHLPFSLQNELLLSSRAFVESKFIWIAEHPLEFEQIWFNGSIKLGNQFYRLEDKLFLVYSLPACEREIIELSRKKQFFDSIIEKKLADQEMKGFGFRQQRNGPLVGFILYRIKEPNELLRMVIFHVEYLLVNETSRGLGTQLLACALKHVESEYPGYNIIAFAESKPIEGTVHFWLKKMNYRIMKKNFVEGAYYPSYKIYPGASILSVPNQLKL